MHSLVAIVHNPLVFLWPCYSTHSIINQSKKITKTVHSLCIAVQLVRLQKELIPAAKSMVMIIVNKIDHSVEDLAELYLITDKAGYHVCVFTRYANLFNKMYGPSIPPQTFLCTHVIFSRISKLSHNSDRSFFANLRMVLQSTSLHSSTLNLGRYQHGRISFDEQA